MRLDEHSKEKMIRKMYLTVLFDVNLPVLVSKVIQTNLFPLFDVFLLKQHIDTAAQEGTAHHWDQLKCGELSPNMIVWILSERPDDSFK